jgi:GH15 family glucan-1,4-alpha-glucosidase
VQATDSKALDASNLVIPMVGFLPPDDPRVQGTIDRSLEELTENGLVYRYRTDETDDGLPGHEGAFGLTTFWLIDALALSGRIDEAGRTLRWDGAARQPRWPLLRGDRSGRTAASSATSRRRSRTWAW